MSCWDERRPDVQPSVGVELESKGFQDSAIRDYKPITNFMQYQGMLYARKLNRKVYKKIFKKFINLSFQLIQHIFIHSSRLRADLILSRTESIVRVPVTPFMGFRRSI